MTLEELKQIIAEGESERVEMKETTGQRGDACGALYACQDKDGETVHKSPNKCDADLSWADMGSVNMSMNTTDEQKKHENNELIDHLAAAIEIVRRKCARCGSSMCMGCNLDRVARGMLPDLLERAVGLLVLMPNDRQGLITEARKSVSERDALWQKIADRHAEDEK